MKLRLFFMTALLVLALAPAAMGDTSSSTGYSGTAGVAQETVTDPGDDGSLPFTGFDALAVGGAGLLLAGVGLGLRTLSRRGSEPGDEGAAA